MLLSLFPQRESFCLNTKWCETLSILLRTNHRFLSLYLCHLHTHLHPLMRKCSCGGMSPSSWAMARETPPSPDMTLGHFPECVTTWPGCLVLLCENPAGCFLNPPTPLCFYLSLHTPPCMSLHKRHDLQMEAPAAADRTFGLICAQNFSVSHPEIVLCSLWIHTVPCLLQYLPLESMSEVPSSALKYNNPVIWYDMVSYHIVQQLFEVCVTEAERCWWWYVIALCNGFSIATVLAQVCAKLMSGRSWIVPAIREEVVSFCLNNCRTSWTRRWNNLVIRG